MLRVPEENESSRHCASFTDALPWTATLCSAGNGQKSKAAVVSTGQKVTQGPGEMAASGETRLNKMTE